MPVDPHVPPPPFERVKRLARRCFNAAVAEVTLLDDIPTHARSLQLQACVNGPQRGEAFVGAPLRGPNGSVRAILWVADCREPEVDAETFDDLCRMAECEIAAARIAASLAQVAEQERRYHDFFENTTDLIVVTDPDGCIRHTSRALNETLKYSDDALIGHTMLELIRPADHDFCRGLVSRIKMGEVVGPFDFVVFDRDGAEVVLEGNLRCTFENGHPMYLRGIFRNITERRAIEHLKDEFVSIVSHELRTPLTSIRGSLGLLAQGLLGALPEKAQRMVDIAVHNTDRLVRLINDILDIERIESGRIAMDRRECAALDLIRQSVEAMQPLAEKAGVVLRVEGDEVQINADPDRMVQTLTNLISNAIKFSLSGREVVISVRRERQEARFSVRDQGRGIPEGKREKIFERFHQVDASDSREKGGTGLGLSICRSIVLQHGGSIWVESELGRGTTFHFTVDAVNLAETLPEQPADPLIVVCDDDRSVRRMLTVMLQHRKFRVAAVSSGTELLENVLQLQPDVILLDLVMPGMSGQEVLAALRLMDRSVAATPVVIVSGLTTDTSDVQRMGVSDWVEKPFDEKHLLGAVQRALGAGNRPLRVLVVEDDIDLGAVLVTMLERKGIDTHHARTGTEAVHLSQKLLPDLIVLDLGLPDVDGATVVDWMRHHNRLSRTPLMVYSARDLGETDREVLRLGPTRFLTKSRVSPSEFENQVVEMLDQISTRQSA